MDPRNRFTTSRTFERLELSARTLTSMCSRWTDATGSSSTILMTLMSLLSCFVTCSSGSASTSTTTVMRDSPGTSVTPTARDSMLKPRRAKRPATRVSRPGLSSTRRLSTCVDMRSVLLLECRGVVERVLDVAVADALRHHRPHHGIGAHHEVDHTGPVVRLEGEVDGGIHVLLLLDADREASVRFGQLDEVGDADGAVSRVQAGVAVAAVVEEGLPLAHHAERRIVDDRDLDRDVVDHAGGELLVRHLEAAVAVDRPDHAIGLGDLGAHRCGHRVPHGPGAAGVQPRV